MNRRAKQGSSTQPFILIDVGDNYWPYTPAELESARAWLSVLPDGPLSQADLADAWEKHDDSKKPAFVASAWLDGGPMTTVLELREASPGITVVLRDDADAVRAETRQLAEVSLPMPPPPRVINWREWRTVKGIPIAPNELIDYDPLRGASWRK